MNPEIINSYTPYIVILFLWDLVCKGIGLWKSGRNGQKNWFIAILMINSIGVVPIVYLKFFQLLPVNVQGGCFVS
jgi:hypothetical protein